MPSSRLSGFYRLSIEERARRVAEWAGLSASEMATLQQSLALAQADKMIENVIGLHALPLGIATNFQINGRDYLIPMVIEEPSVVAGASHAARLVREGGGFQAESEPPVMIGQIQVLDLPDVRAAQARVRDQKSQLLEAVQQAAISRHGRARDIEARIVPQSPVGPMLIVHLLYECGDAMGANMVNTACEALAPKIEELTGGRVNLRILSNLADRRLARARCVVPAQVLATDDLPGPIVVDRIIEAHALAVVDPYRAATHNKGIMNGVDAVVLATGNDWRAIEAGAHAYAARSGRYRPLSDWGRDANGNLVGYLEMPMALGIVGGTPGAHPTARMALRILGVRSARELAEVAVAVGLAQNLAALRALATEGIQRGHMALHARQIAIAAGATAEEVDWVVDRMVAERAISLERARELLARRRVTDPSEN